MLSRVRDKLPKFRLQVLPISPIMSQVSDGGILLILKYIASMENNKMFLFRLSSENISSPYDDRLDKRYEKSHFFRFVHLLECILVFPITCVILTTFSVSLTNKVFPNPPQKCTDLHRNLAQDPKQELHQILHLHWKKNNQLPHFLAGSVIYHRYDEAYIRWIKR